MNVDQDFDLNIPDPHATILSGPARVGAELRSVREHLGWQLPDIAARLKIRQVFLEAIEAGNLSALPAPAYAAGFIRSYAEAMGLDPEEILRRFRAEGMSRPRQPRLAFPEPVPDRAVPPGAIIFLVAVIGIGGYFLWYRHSEHELKMAQMVPTVPAKLAPLAVPKSAPPPATTTTSTTTTTGTATTPTTTAATPPPAQPATTTATTDTGTDNATTASSAAAGTSGTAATDTGSAATASAATPSKPTTTSSATTTSDTSNASAPTGDMTANSAASKAAAVRPPATPPASAKPAIAAAAGPLVVTATATSWVQVKDAKGTILFSRVLKPGQSWPVPDEPGLTLTTGNAGGTVLVRKGVAGPPLGKSGIVLHDVPITPQAGGAGANPPAGAAAQ